MEIPSTKTSRIEAWVGRSRWFLLTVTFEVLFGRFVMGLRWERLGSDYSLLNGGLMPLGLLVMLFIALSLTEFSDEPLLQPRIRSQ